MREINIEFVNPQTNERRYPLNDIGAGNLFFDTFKSFIRYVKEPKTWFYHDGVKWQSDTQKIFVMQYAKRAAIK